MIFMRFLKVGHVYLKIRAIREIISGTSRKDGYGDVDREMMSDHLTNVRRTRPF